MTPRAAITILMPCKSQKREFFLDSVGSILRQDAPDWELIILTDPSSPDELADWASSFCEPRIRLLRCPETGFARALNFGLRETRTPFVAILLSDDRYSPNAVSTLLDYQRRYPDVDFFHSSRRHITPGGNPFGGVMQSRSGFTLDDFITRGSPVKHLLCWRLARSMEIGGMDESLSVHGCDDYDFPWRMAESGARFQAVEECLYEYRLHHAHDRLTTTVPVERQISTLAAMFNKHGVSARQADRYIQRALGGYLIREFTGHVKQNRGRILHVRCFREAPDGSMPQFAATGFKQRHFFPHRVFVLPKGGPDGYKLSQRMGVSDDPSVLLEFVLYALPPVSDRFPDELYFDDDVVWHRQQFGLRAQVACADVVREEQALRCYLLQSDLVQRIARAPRYRTQIDNRFKGWSRLLLNAILVHASENNLPAVYLAASELVLRHTDRRRNPEAPLYTRIYDETPRQFEAVREGDWWRIDVQRNAGRIAPLDRTFEVDPWPKTVCIMHDIERGLGHTDVDPEFAARADLQTGAALERMLEIEARLGVRATYNVVGLLYTELQEPIRRGGHVISFHSFDHRLEAGSEQLRHCRSVDYRVKGYRAPQSRIPPSLSDASLAAENFEWLATSAYSAGFKTPRMEHGIVKIPVHLDDHALYRDGIGFAAWERSALELIEQRDFVVIGLHDCYAHFWLDHYEEFLRKIQERASLMTLDEVAARVTLGHARWFEEQ